MVSFLFNNLNCCRSPDNRVQPDESDRQAHSSDCETCEMRSESRATAESSDYHGSQLLDRRCLNHRPKRCEMWYKFTPLDSHCSTELEIRDRAYDANFHIRAWL